MFFATPDGRTSTARSSKQLGYDHQLKNINRSVVLLIERGHNDVLEYDWDLYSEVLDYINSQEQ